MKGDEGWEEGCHHGRELKLRKPGKMTRWLYAEQEDAQMDGGMTGETERRLERTADVCGGEHRHYKRRVRMWAGG